MVDQGITGPGPQPGPGPLPVDMSGGLDLNDRDADAGVPSACDEMSCGVGATCMPQGCVCNEGLQGDPRTGCFLPLACDGVDCPVGSYCSDGQCACFPGFLQAADGCTAAPVSPTTERTREEVCTRFSADQAAMAAQSWERQPTETCDPGALHPEWVIDGVRATNLARWLVGQPPVTTGAFENDAAQNCAMILAARGAGLTHNIPEDAPCYNQSGATGAGASNISVGVGSPRSSVWLYIHDPGVLSLGHRNWIFSSGFTRTGFGFRSSYSCMWVVNGQRSYPQGGIAYPAPGYFPSGALLGEWSVVGRSGNNNITDVVITTSEGESVPVTGFRQGSSGGFGPSFLAWRVSNPPLEIPLTVQLMRDEDVDHEYVTTLTSCQ